MTQRRLLAIASALVASPEVGAGTTALAAAAVAQEPFAAATSAVVTQMEAIAPLVRTLKES